MAQRVAVGAQMPDLGAAAHGRGIALEQERERKFPLSKLLRYYPRDASNALVAMKLTALMLDCSLGLLGLSVVERTLGQILPRGTVEIISHIRGQIAGARLWIAPWVRVGLASDVVWRECLPYAGLIHDPGLRLDAVDKRRSGRVARGLELLNPCLAALFSTSALLAHIAKSRGIATTRFWLGLQRFNRVGGGVAAKGLASLGAYSLFCYYEELGEMSTIGRAGVDALRASEGQLLDFGKYGLECLAAILLLSPIGDWRVVAVAGMGLKLGASSVAFYQSWRRTKNAVLKREWKRDPVNRTCSGRGRSNSCSSVLKRSPRTEERSESTGD